jgi:hypothetical protein
LKSHGYLSSGFVNRHYIPKISRCNTGKIKSR